MTTAISTYRMENATPAVRLTFWAAAFGRFHRWSTAVAKRRQLRRDLHGFEPRLLLDMGVDPAELYGEFWSYEEVQRREAGRLNRVRPLPWR